VGHRWKILAFGCCFLFISTSCSIVPSFPILGSSQRAVLLRQVCLTNTTGVVTLTFDDGYQEIYDNAFPVLNQFNVNASLFVVTGISEFQGSSLMNFSALVELKAHGWDIDAHTVTHPYLTRLNLSEMRFEILNSKLWIIQHGLGDPLAFAYPYGRSNLRSRLVVLKNYQFGRTLVRGFNDLSARKNPALRTFALWGTPSSGSLELCKRMVLRGYTTGKWVIITLHGVTTDPTFYKVGARYMWTTADTLAEFLTFLADNSIPVMTFSQFASRY
jgi:peptidoglycan/xylan/chitin deacetylase (PgdA/CDA1 family)